MLRDLDILLVDFSEADRKAFWQVGRSKDYTLHQVLVHEEEIGSSMYLIETGEISIWMKGLKLSRLGAGSILGASSLIEPHRRTATAMAEDYVHALIFRREDVLLFFKSRPARLFQQFFFNCFRMHMDLVHRCNDTIVELDRQVRRGNLAR